MAKEIPESKIPQFDVVESIRKVVQNMQLVENLRARDRALIDTLANGERPYSPEEVEKYQIRYNVNWGELNRQLRSANGQVNGALLYKPLYFTATSNGGQVEKRDEYGQIFTTKVNKFLKKGDLGKQFRYVLKSRNASVCLHGIGPVYWPNDYCVIPKFVPLENLLIPSDTMCDFSNLSYFNIKVQLTPYELFTLTHSDTVDENWNMDQVNEILDGLKLREGMNPNNYNWVEHPEKMQELYKQNRCYLNSDEASKVKLDYFFNRKDDVGDWTLKIFLREGMGEADSDNFVYEGSQPFSKTIEQILHVQYGDNSIVAPLKFHSVRGLGQSLYSPAEAINRFRSGLFQHAEEQLRMYFYLNEPGDRARQNVIELMQYGIIEDGVKIVPESERHQVDANLIESVMAQCNQNLSENAASFVQSIDNGTEKEMTLGEAQIRQQSVNMSVSSLLTMMYIEEAGLYIEIVRRLLNKSSGEDDIEEFQKSLIAAGIPKELLKPENWEIQPERVLGSGDQSLALQEATALFQSRTAFDPKSQRIIDRQFVSTLTKDPAKGLLIVPDAPDNATDGAKVAASFFGTLMTGSEVPLVQGIPQADYITEMMKLMGGVIQRITQTDNMGTMQEVIGLETVGNDIAQHIEILAADPTQKQSVKVFSDALGKLMNLVKAFGQRIAAKNKTQQTAPKVLESINYKDVPDDVKRQMEQAAGLQPSQMPVPDPKVAKANQQLAINDAKFQQKQSQNAISFQIQQIQKLTAHNAEMTQQQREHNQQLAHDASMKLMELISDANQPAPESAPQSN